LPCPGANHAWRHHTRLEVPASLTRCVQSRVAVLLCDLARLPCPRPVRFIRLAERVGLASACQGRGRGRTREPWARTRRLCRRQRGGPLTRQGAGRRVLGPPGRSQPPPRRTAGVRDAGSSPDASREAPGAPALRPEARRQRSIATAMVRLRREETARPRGCARMLRAFPWFCLFSNRRKRCWPWGL
jgi:hypothetical protein